MIEIIVDKKKLKKTDNLFIRIGNASQKPPLSALKQIGITMIASVDKNFEYEGRPVRWAPLSAMTLAMRRNRNKASAKILQDTGNLRRSITYDIREDGEAVAIGTSVPYAAIHQYGGKIRIPARTIVPKKAKALRFIVNGKEVFAKSAKQKARTVTIPQRKFLMFQDEDISDIRTILLEALMDESNQ